MSINLQTKKSGEIVHLATLASNTEVVKLAGEQTIVGNKYFSGTITAPTKSTTDSSDNVATTAYVSARLENLPAKEHTHGNLSNSGKVGTAANLVLITGAGGALATSSISGTELGYLSGLTSNVQYQLNNKLDSTGTAIKAVADSAGNTFTITYAPLDSPSFVGTPKSVTPPAGDVSNKIATTLFVNSAIESISIPTVPISIDSTNCIDVSIGTVFTKTILEDTVFTFSNNEPKSTCIKLVLTNGGSATITWPYSILWENGVEPSLTLSGVDVILFITVDAGDTWFGIPYLNFKRS